MHELGIAQSILDAVAKEMARYPGSRVVKVGVRIGPMAGVDRDSLSFCFGLAGEQDGAASPQLAIEDGVADELDLQYLELEDS